MKITKHYQAYRKKPYVARWRINSKSHNRFFATEIERDTFIDQFQQESIRQDTTIPVIEPRKLLRWQEAAGLAPEADPLQVYRFWLRHKKPETRLIRLHEAEREYLRMMAQVKRHPGYIGHVRKGLEDFQEELGNRYIHEFETEAIRQHLFGLPYEDITIRHRRTYLLGAFDWWKAQGWITDNPVKRVERPTVEDEEPGILTAEETEKLFRVNQKVDPGICGLLALAAFAGMRISAIARLDYEEIHFDQHGILTRAKKTKKKRRHYIQGLPDNLWPWLIRTPPEVFQLTLRQMQHRRAEALKRAGLLVEADDIARENRKRETKGLPLVTWQVKHPPKNCFRHSFVSYHIAVHKNPGQTRPDREPQGSGGTLGKLPGGRNRATGREIFFHFTPKPIKPGDATKRRALIFFSVMSVLHHDAF